MPSESLTNVAADDVVQPFQIDRADVRGRLVRLGPALDAVLSGHGYPDAVATLLGELLVVAVATAGAFKFHGMLSLQTQSDGAVPLMIAEYRAAPAEDGPIAPARLRGYARFEADKVTTALREGGGTRSNAERLLGKGSLAFTVEPAAGAERYQGITALDGPSIVESVHAYFRQSEQLDAAIRVDVGRVARIGGHGRGDGDGSSSSVWRAGGVLVQRMPAKSATRSLGERDDDEWCRVLALVGSSGRLDLLDPKVTARDMLRYLFPEDDVRAYQPVQVEGRCRCSRERVDMVLRSFPAAEIADMVVDGVITVTCEFCNTHYRFAPGDLDPR
jgi:molecular chaperone Hsp33